MKAHVVVTCFGLMLAGVSAHAECTYPKAPESIPNGSTASEAEMVAAMGTFKQYNSDVEAYLACLDTEMAERVKTASAGSIMEVKALQSKKHNAAVDELKTNASKFNEQVKVFKSKH